jgi:hypothetical protein
VKGGARTEAKENAVYELHAANFTRVIVVRGEKPLPAMKPCRLDHGVYPPS